MRKTPVICCYLFPENGEQIPRFGESIPLDNVRLDAIILSNATEKVK